jgi:hypothetical protein
MAARASWAEKTTSIIAGEARPYRLGDDVTPRQAF